MSRCLSKRSKSKLEFKLDDGMLGPALELFFCNYLIGQRQLSPRTIAAYRDTFRLLLDFFERCRARKPDDLRVSDLDADTILAFLDDLERHRRNCTRSRNLRLTTIRSFMRHATASNPLLLPVAQRVLAIPTKRFERGLVQYLSRSQNAEPSRCARYLDQYRTARSTPIDAYVQHRSTSIGNRCPYRR